MKKLLSLFLLVSLLCFCITGCGKKDSYTSIVSDFTSLDTGTFNYEISLSATNTETGVVDSVKVNVERGVLTNTDDYTNMTLLLGEGNEVYVNTVLYDGIRYLNLQDLKESLSLCDDVLLRAYGETVPVNIAYTVVDEHNLKITSLFAEQDEIDDAYITSLHLFESRLDVLINMLLNEAVITKGAKLSGSDGVYVIEGTSTFSSSFIGLINNVGIFYGKYASTLRNNDMSTEYEDSTGFLAEKDNFMSMFSDLWVSYGSLGSVGLDPTMKGSVSVYESKENGDDYEGNLGLTWNDSSTSYSASVIFTRKASVSEIVMPAGSTVDLAVFDSTYFKVSDMMTNLFRKANLTRLDLFNTSLVSSDESLTNDVSMLISEYLGIDSGSVADYVVGNKGDDKVKSLMVLLDSITGGFKLTVEVEEEVVLEQFTKITGIFSNSCEYAVSVNTDLTKSSLLAVDIRVLNQTDKEVTIQSKKFSIRDMGTNKISANIKSQLLEVFSDFDTSLYLDSIVVPSGGFIDTTLYFVVPEELGYFDLYLNDEVVGNIVSF